MRDGDLWDYCVDDPINAVDQNGLATKGIGIGLSGSAFGFGAGFGGMVVKDDKGNWGIEGYVDYGASSGFGGSVDGSYQTTTADTIKELAGTSQKAGGSLKLPGVPVSLGAEKIKGNGYTGDSYSLGVGVKSIAPLETHAKLEQSSVRVLSPEKDQ